MVTVLGAAVDGRKDEFWREKPMELNPKESGRGAWTLERWTMRPCMVHRLLLLPY